jgi:hypothetical protein
MGHLLLCDGERQRRAEPGEQLVGPSVGGDHNAIRSMAVPVRRRHIDSAAPAGIGPDVDHGRTVAKDRAVGPRGPLHRSGASGRRNDRRVRLVQGDGSGGEAYPRPATGDLGGVQNRIGDARRRHAGGVAADRDGGIGWEEVEAAHDGDELVGGIGGQRGPVVVRLAGERHIPGCVVGPAQDP